MTKGAAAIAAIVLVALAVCVDGHTQAVAPDQPYLFIDTGNMSKLGERLIEAGNEGYELLFMARCPSGSHAGAILKRDGTERNYRFVHTRRYTSFVEELNEAGSQSFRVVPAAMQAFNPGAGGDNRVAVLARQSNGARFTYSAVKGDGDGAKVLTEASKRGVKLIAVLGDQFIFEEIQGASDISVAAGEREYRIVTTAKTSSLEKEIQQAAADGFRAIQSGSMRVLMEREPGSTTAPLDYRVIAMTRVNTAERELQAAGAEGFRIALVPECKGSEGMFVLIRTPGTSERFDYRIVTLGEQTANGWLVRAEAEGYRVVVLFSNFVVFERPLAR